MLAIGDVHVYVTDLVTALRFWSDGLQLAVVERESTRSSGFARLEPPDGSAGLCLIAAVDAWEAGRRPDPGTRPMVAFEIATSTFDGTLARLVEHGGTPLGAVEEYGGLRGVTMADPDGNTFELLELPDQP